MTITLNNYPAKVPVLVLPGTVLMPHAHLPVTISDPRQSMLVDLAIKQDRLIGVLQSSPLETLFTSGCLAKISSFTELDSLKYLLVLTGLVRFELEEVPETNPPVHPLKVRYMPEDSTETGEAQIVEDRERLMMLLENYFESYNISANWDEIQASSDEKLISTLAMVCPFEPVEKQALLETKNLKERCQMMTALMEMAVFKKYNSSYQKH